ncbi:DUF1016 family protein [Streptomyces sp. ISL-96]|uniref:PDDEXK nuclease domain-containing protein n=1 Tax=Streptomyces sp. ISL-96 TaxID=2819191 RepID=UPI001BE9818C|nr:PDDEXK nuclease domain-containing protein [Streptomyces sp. ISL-96]MBT2488863.1 DUF1016 family protein [Streptomyces sp. ISL-96]
MNEEITAKPVVPAQPSGLPPGFFDLVAELKNLVRGAHVRAQLKVNAEMLQMYWDIGRTILERQRNEKWGTKVIERISAELRTEFPNQRGFSRANLHYMQQMAPTWPEPIVQQAVGQLPWGHIVTLMGKCKTRTELDFYAQHAVRNGWSRDDLASAVHRALHLSHGAAANNFDAVIPIDLLFYHCKLHCFVVVELKTRAAAPQHLGQLGFYVEVVDDLVRDKAVDGPTIGILIADSKNQPVVEYALRSQRNPLAAGTYAALPEPVRKQLPSGEDLARLADRALHPAEDGQ